jgi:hypothetical protein
MASSNMAAGYDAAGRALVTGGVEPSLRAEMQDGSLSSWDRGTVSSVVGHAGGSMNSAGSYPVG